MTKNELERLKQLDERIREIAAEEGLRTRDVIFETVPSQRVLEGMSYWFPTNFSHWSFGRDYEKNRTRYENSGHGIPYEQVWNFDPPRAFLVESNPFILNVIVLAHVYGHDDFFSGSRYCQQGSRLSDMSEESRLAAKRFAEYEERYGKAEVEQLIDAGMSIMWHQHPDPFYEEQDEEIVRERLISLQYAKLERDTGDLKGEFGKPLTPAEIEGREKELERLASATPPEPTYDLLRYIINHSPRLRKPWMRDVLTVLWNQARVLAPNGRTKMLNEGWATYWHVRILRRLFAEGLLTPEEHELFNHYHSGVVAESFADLNMYRIGLAFYEYVKERWDKGQFGRDYEKSEDPYKRSHWDTHAGLGKEKIFEIRTAYSDRMAVESLFTDEFIHENRLYIYGEAPDKSNGKILYVIMEDDPKIIREYLKSMFTHYGVPLIVVENGNTRNHQELFLGHEVSGYYLDPAHRDRTLEKIHYLWGRPVHLRTPDGDEWKIFSYNGKEHKVAPAKD